MKIWWRQQEMFFAGSVFVILLIGHLVLRQAEISGDAHSLAAHFRDAGVAYDYSRHSLTPFLLSFGVPLALLLLINGWIIPRYSHHRHRIWILTSAAILSWCILIISYGLQYYLRFYYISQQTGAPAFEIDARRDGIALGSVVIIIYLLYAALRESIILWLERTKDQQPFRVMVCNRITFTAFLYVLLMVCGVSSGVFRSDGPAIAYTFILLPVIITCFVNIYILFPKQHTENKTFYTILPRLGLAPFILSFGAWLFYTLATGHFRFLLLPALFFIILILATPLSWLFYIQQREKINSFLTLEKQLGKTTADLAFLRSQINPHFLFNTLNTLYGTALQEQASRTASGIQRLGDMMRFLLHDNHRETIPVIREVEYLQHYIMLQSLRIADAPGIRIETSISDAKCEHSIAPMLLIPFVENAFKHGIRLTKPSYIIIKFYCDDAGVYLDVVNSRHTHRDTMNEEGYSGVGMENVKQRLELLYPGSHTLQIHEDDNAFQVHLFIRLPR